MLAWSEGTDNGRQKTRNHGYDVIMVSDHLRQNSINRRRTLPASFPLVGCLQAKQAQASPKSQDAVALQQIKAWRFTYD